MPVTRTPCDASQSAVAPAPQPMSRASRSAAPSGRSVRPHRANPRLGHGLAAGAQTQTRRRPKFRLFIETKGGIDVMRHASTMPQEADQVLSPGNAEQTPPD